MSEVAAKGKWVPKPLADENESTPSLRFPEFKADGPWQLRKLGQALREESRPIEMDDHQTYSLVIVKRRYGGIVSRGQLKGRGIKVKSQFLVNTDDFLISKRQIVHCACALVPDEFSGSIVSNEYSVFRSMPGFHIGFFWHFSHQPSVSRSFMDCSVGIVIEKMLFKPNQWLDREFLFPSYNEQSKIAQFLSVLDELITAKTEKLEALKQHKKGLLQQLFPAEGEITPRFRFPQYETAPEWKITTLQAVATIRSGTTPSRTNASFFQDGTIPWVKTMDLNNSEIHHTEEMVTESSGVRVNPAGSVLVAMYGGSIRLGEREC